MQPVPNNDFLSVTLARGLAGLSVFIYHYGTGPVLARITGVPEFRSSTGLPFPVLILPCLYFLSLVDSVFTDQNGGV